MKKITAMIRHLMEEKMVEAIGAHDAFSARLVELSGFDAVYLSGLTSTVSFLARPDMVFMTMSERLQIAHSIAPAVDVPVIADAEEGYGNAIHMMEPIRRFEEAGIAGVLTMKSHPASAPLYKQFSIPE